MAKRSQRKSQKPSYSNKNNGSKNQGSSNSGNKHADTKDEGLNNKSDGQEQPPQEPTQGNDPEWYMRDPSLVRDAASIYFSYAFGKLYYLGGSGRHMQGANVTTYITPPGICAIRLKPSLGFSDSTTSPLNVSANSIYAFVRHMNSGRKNYDPADLMNYLTAIANLYSAIVWAERLYNFAFSYSNSNRYIGDALLGEEGIDASNFRLNLANYRMKLNEFISKVSVFAVPKNITYFNKCAYMYRDIILENGEGNLRDQLYMYVPDGFYKFALDADNLGMLDYVHWNHGPNSGSQTLAVWTDVIDLLENLMSGIFADEDASLISGDLFKVYGEEIIRLVSLDESGVLPLVYDPMVLWQMKNATPRELQRRGNSETASMFAANRLNTSKSEYSLGTGRTQKGRPGCVFQDSNGMLVTCERYLDDNESASGKYSISNIHSYMIGTNKILTSDLADPTVGVIMESSRMIIGPHDAPKGYGGTETNKNLGWVNCGSFVPVSASIAVYQGTSDRYPYQHVAYTYVAYNDTNRLTINSEVAEIMPFKYAPLMYGYQLAEDYSVDYCHPISDIANFAVLDINSVDKLHEAALLSLLYVPGIARVG